MFSDCYITLLFCIYWLQTNVESFFKWHLFLIKHNALTYMYKNRDHDTEKLESWIFIMNIIHYNTFSD